MAGSLFSSRKCLSFGAAKWVAVSRVGPSTRPPSTSESNTIAHEDGRNNATAIIVVAGTVSALLCLCIFVLVLRNNRFRHRRESGTTAGPDGHQEPTVKSQGHDEEEACNEGDGRRSAQRVELVVMAGEDMPTFLAHPVPAPSMAIIQCPPLQH